MLYLHEEAIVPPRTHQSRRRSGGSLPSMAAAAQAIQRDFLKELGVRPIINGAGVYTFTTASLMRPEVVDAIRAISANSSAWMSCMMR